MSRKDVGCGYLVEGQTIALQSKTHQKHKNAKHFCMYVYCLTASWVMNQITIKIYHENLMIYFYSNNQLRLSAEGLSQNMMIFKNVF